MRKLRNVLIVLSVAALTMTGCQKKEAATAASDAAASPDSKITLKVLNYTDLTVANAPQDQAFIWDTFRTANPDINLEIENLFNEPFHNKTEAYAASGNMPDVMYVWPSGRSTSLHAKKLLKDLAPLVQKDNLREKYLPLTMDPNQQFGKYLAMIPWGITSTHAFYINMEVLNDCGLQPATTYEELKAQVPVLKAKGYETVIMPNQDTWVMQSCLFSLVAGRFGGAGWEEKILNGSVKFTDADFVNALEFIRSMYADGVLAGSSLGMAYGEGPGLFATNKGAYYIDGDWRAGIFITNPETNEALIDPARQNNFKVTIFPDITGAKLNKSTSAVLGTGWAMSSTIPADSAQEEAAWRLIKWLTGPEVESLTFEHGGLPTPSRTDIDYSTIQVEPISTAMASLGNEYNASTCVIDGVFHSDVFNPLNDGLQEIGLGTKTPAQVAADVQKAFDSAKAAGKF